MATLIGGITNIVNISLETWDTSHVFLLFLRQSLNLNKNKK